MHFLFLFIFLLNPLDMFSQESFVARLAPDFSIIDIAQKGFTVSSAFPVKNLSNDFSNSFVRIHCSNSSSLDKLVDSGLLLYWETIRKQSFHYVPSDIFYSEQWHLDKISASSAWDISRGDSSFFVGIIDSGVDYNHEDLRDNLAYNYADPINGIDDDQDGYIDNYYGWDFGSNDSDPMIDGYGVLSHGSIICGVAACSTDNFIGSSSPGFLCQYLPVKVTNSSGEIIDSNEGILYAALMGAKVINCSYGSNQFSQAEADIISYVTDELDVLVVASSGNDDSNTLVYPAALDEVVAVCALDQDDTKIPISNFGSYIDLGAPGESIYAPSFQDSYTYRSGTSVSTGIVSGAAILIRSKFPQESWIQIKNRLIYSCDPYPSKNNFEGLLGQGRLNIARAMEKNYTYSRSLSIYPNPSNGCFQAKLDILKGGNYQVSVFDVLGNLYHREHFDAEPGVSIFYFDLDHLKPGHYIIKLSGKESDNNVFIII
jgi:subtilisin family serine protease